MFFNTYSFSLAHTHDLLAEQMCALSHERRSKWEQTVLFPELELLFTLRKYILKLLTIVKPLKTIN